MCRECRAVVAPVLVSVSVPVGVRVGHGVDDLVGRASNETDDKHDAHIGGRASQDKTCRRATGGPVGVRRNHDRCLGFPSCVDLGTSWLRSSSTHLMFSFSGHRSRVSARNTNPTPEDG